jgi:hypothetical protein
MTNGWIKIHRKILNNIIFQNDKAFKIWIWCLLKANHQENECLIGRIKIKLKSGQFVFGSNKAKEELKMSKSTIHYWMSFLKAERYIERKITSKYSIITILNYFKYQQPERKIKRLPNAKWSDKRTIGGPINETNKNVKNDKNVKNILPKGSITYGNTTINEIISYLKNKAGWVDGSSKRQRYDCKIFTNRVSKLIKEMGGEVNDHTIITGCKRIIDLAAQDKFHSKNMGRIRYLYDNIGSIVRSTQADKPKVAIIK